MRQYYRNKETTEERILSSNISNGIILSTYCEESGREWGGHSSNKLFVTKEQLDNEWVPFNFAVTVTSDGMAKEAVVKMFKHMMNELHQYGILEDGRDEMYAIEDAANAIELALFGDAKDENHLRQHISNAVKSSTPEDYADEILFSDGDQFFYLLHHLKDSINEMVNTLTKGTTDGSK